MAHLYISVYNQVLESKSIIEKLVHRDVNIENLKYEIELLQKEISSYKDQIEKLTNENIELSNKIYAYEARKRFKSI